MPKDALEGKGPQRRPQKRLGRRSEEVAKAVGAGYCLLQMPVRLALAVRGTVAGHRLGALEGGGGTPPPLPMHPGACLQGPLCTHRAQVCRECAGGVPQAHAGPPLSVRVGRAQGHPCPKQCMSLGARTVPSDIVFLVL